MERGRSTDLWDALGALRSRVLDEMQGGLPELGLELTIAQHNAFSQVAAAGPLTIGALGRRLRRSQAATSHLVSQLELRGYVERGGDPEDARRTMVHVSKEGARQLARLEKLRKRSFERVLARVPTRVREALEDAMVATLEALDGEDAS